MRSPWPKRELPRPKFGGFRSSWICRLPISQLRVSIGRVQYGEHITRKAAMIERAEKLLHELGFRECRVRHHDKLARIEVPADQITRLADPELRSRIDAEFRELGYHCVTLDMRCSAAA